MNGVLFDVGYETQGRDAVIKVTLKNEDGIVELYDRSFRPYLLVEASAAKDIEMMASGTGGDGILGVEKVTRRAGRAGGNGEDGRDREFLKVLCRHPKDVITLREILRNIAGVYEDNISFSRRYIIDKRLRPMAAIEVETDGADGREIVRISDAGDTDVSVLNILCFDIEVYAPFLAPREWKDPIIMISYYDLKRRKVGAITWKWAEGVDTGRIELTVVKDEREMLKRFCELVRERDIDILIGYNSASFDLPYMAKRAKALGINLSIGRDGSEPELRRTGMTARVSIDGRAHFDVFYMVRLLAAAQALKTQRYTLEEVYAEILGKKKIDIDEHEMCSMWDDDGRRKEYIEYACSDAESTAEIFEKVSPLAFELCKLAQIPLNDASGATSGQLVESLLMNAAAGKGMLIPNKPGGEEIGEREEEPIAGAYVKLPEPGIYDRVAVFDFRSLYPSIIVSHGIDPYTVNCGHPECMRNNTSPLGHHFCTKREGVVPSTLRELLDRRRKLKAALKAARGDERILLNARVAALKIVTNSMWGYLRYARSRWYSREAAESITGWGRFYIQDVAKKAEESGFTVLYADTDSLFLLLGDKTEDEAVEFVHSINAGLPETMELELEDFYSRGVFVAKKHEKGTKGAKKKYALISKDGRIKIRGFELVRRDWSKIARDTQRRVLETILVDGSKEKAMSIIKEVVQDLKGGNIGKEDLVIYTQLRKKSYEVTSPELAAAEKARKRGMKISTGAIIGYVITKGGKSISEKAELAQFAQDYDPDYYINNQVIPAVLRILGELGYSEDDIKYVGKQPSLGTWM